MRFSECLTKGISRWTRIVPLAAVALLAVPGVEAGAVLDTGGVVVTMGGSVNGVPMTVGELDSEPGGAGNLAPFGQLTGVKVYGTSTNSANSSGSGSAWIEWTGKATGSLMNLAEIHHTFSLGAGLDAKEEFSFTGYEIEIALNDVLSGPFSFNLPNGTRDFTSGGGMSTTWNPPLTMDMESWRVRATVYFTGASSGDFFFFQVPSSSIDVNVPFGGPAVPEPSTWAMLITGIGALAVARRR